MLNGSAWKGHLSFKFLKFSVEVFSHSNPERFFFRIARIADKLLGLPTVHCLICNANLKQFFKRNNAEPHEMSIASLFVLVPAVHSRAWELLSWEGSGCGEGGRGMTNRCRRWLTERSTCHLRLAGDWHSWHWWRCGWIPRWKSCFWNVIVHWWNLNIWDYSQTFWNSGSNHLGWQQRRLGCVLVHRVAHDVVGIAGQALHRTAIQLRWILRLHQGLDRATHVGWAVWHVQSKGVVAGRRGARLCGFAQPRSTIWEPNLRWRWVMMSLTIFV